MKKIIGCLIIGLCLIGCSSEPIEINPCDGKENGEIVDSTETPCVVEYCLDGHPVIGNAPKGYACVAHNEVGLCDGQQVCALCGGEYPGDLIADYDCTNLYCATSMEEPLVATPIESKKTTMECQ